jgi:hypothetical protein
MSGGSKTQTTTQQTVIPEEVKPLLSQYLSQAQGLSQQSPNNLMMRTAANDMYGQTANAYGGIDAARQGLLGVTQQTPGQNPYLDQTINKAMGDITALTDSGLDERLNAMAAAKAPKVEVEVDGGEGMESEAGEFTPDEVEKLKALLAQMEA